MTTTREIERLIREGQRMRARLFDIKRLASDEPLRAAILVPKFGMTAVRRNQLKRRVREIVRLNLIPSSLRGDVLIRARRGAYDATHAALQADLTALVSKLQVDATP